MEETYTLQDSNILSYDGFLELIKSNKSCKYNIKIFKRIIDIEAVKREINIFTFLKSGIQKDMEILTLDHSLDIVMDLDKRLKELENKAINIFNSIERQVKDNSSVQYIADFDISYSIESNSRIWYNGILYAISEIHNNLNNPCKYLLLEPICVNNRLKSLSQKINIEELHDMVDCLCNWMDYVRQEHMSFWFRLKSIFKWKKD